MVWDTPAPAFTTDRIGELATDETAPAIVSISDIHGYLADARSALLAVGESDQFDPVVTADGDGRLHWADNDSVLVFNGDLVDRGNRNDATVALALRLMREAPPGRVQYLLGNHEMAILLPEVLSWPRTYSQELDRDRRRQFVSLVTDGVVRAAFDGYEYTYSHAGDADGVDVDTVNESARRAGDELLAAMDSGQYDSAQADVPRRFADVFGLGGSMGRGADAGILWMDFQHMPADAPPQVVGHTKQRAPTWAGRAICENVIRTTHGSPGGEAVLVETPDALSTVTRQPDGSVSVEPT
ncbi:MAG: metallophosphoesterase [Haloferacaceae archaeon]